MMIHQELDKWALDLEQAFENGTYIDLPRLKRQHMKLIEIRDRLYKEKVERIKEENSLCRGYRANAPIKYCTERYGPPKPGPRIIQC